MYIIYTAAPEECRVAVPCHRGRAGGVVVGEVSEQGRRAEAEEEGAARVGAV